MWLLLSMHKFIGFSQAKKRKVAKAVDIFCFEILMYHIFTFQFVVPARMMIFMRLSSWCSFCFLVISWLIELNPYEWSQLANIKRGTFSSIVHFRLYSLEQKFKHDLNVTFYWTLLDGPILTWSHCKLKRNTFMGFLF